MHGTVGKRFRRGGTWITVVGVIKDVRRHRQGPDQPQLAQMFLPLRQNIGNSRNMVLVVRTTSEPLALASAVRKTVGSIDDGIPVSQVTTLESMISESQSLRRFQTWLLILFASFALLLAAIGIYGLMHYSVAQRNHEIGIRMAVGANRSDVLRLIIRQGLAVVLVGEAVGLAAAIGLSQTMSSLLFEVEPMDPATLAIVTLLLTGVGASAIYIPARRAAKVDSMKALRYE